MSPLGAFAAAGAAVCGATYLYRLLEGGSFWAEVREELSLTRLSLADADAYWANNPRRSATIVSLTSIPSRLPYIGETLKSLMLQTCAPARIVLNLPSFSRREQRPYDVPAFVRGLKAVELVSCEDWGPATKLIPSLQRYARSQPIVAVDDDRIYPSNLVADLDDAVARYPDCALGFSGWRVPDDLTDRPTTLWANLFKLAPAPVRATRLRAPVATDILQGMSGYLVRPSFFDLAALIDYVGAPEGAFFVDDVWISGHCRAPKLVIPARRLNYPPKRRARFYKATSVALVNRGDGTPESRNNTIVIFHLRDAWLCSRRPRP